MENQTFTALLTAVGASQRLCGRRCTLVLHRGVLLWLTFAELDRNKHTQNRHKMVHFELKDILTIYTQIGLKIEQIKKNI